MLWMLNPFFSNQAPAREVLAPQGYHEIDASIVYFGSAPRPPMDVVAVAAPDPNRIRAGNLPQSYTRIAAIQSPGYGNLDLPVAPVINGQPTAYDRLTEALLTRNANGH